MSLAIQTRQPSSIFSSSEAPFAITTFKKVQTVAQKSLSSLSLWEERLTRADTWLSSVTDIANIGSTTGSNLVIFGLVMTPIVGAVLGFLQAFLCLSCFGLELALCIIRFQLGKEDEAIYILCSALQNLVYGVLWAAVAATDLFAPGVSIVLKIALFYGAFLVVGVGLSFVQNGLVLYRAKKLNSEIKSLISSYANLSKGEQSQMVLLELRRQFTKADGKKDEKKAAQFAFGLNSQKAALGFRAKQKKTSADSITDELLEPFTDEEAILKVKEILKSSERRMAFGTFGVVWSLFYKFLTRKQRNL
ncbi:MAG: hypothetical protein WCP39_06655 [Chlamydiota bacterium]